MKKLILLIALGFMASPLHAAELKEQVIAAAKKLGDQPNYSWKTTVTVNDDSRFRPGPTEGKTEKDGFTLVTTTFGERTSQTVLKGDKGAVTGQDDAWRSLEELERETEGFGRFRAAMARNLKTPAVQAADIAAGTKELKKEGEVYSGELTEEGVRTLLSFRGRGANVSNPQGKARFWIKDGQITKYEYDVKGTVSFNNNDVDLDRTTTVEVMDVGTTMISVPEEAKKKIS